MFALFLVCCKWPNWLGKISGWVVQVLEPHTLHARTRQFIRCPYRCLSAVLLPKNWYHSITMDFVLIDCNSTTIDNSNYPMKFNNNDLKRTSNQ